MMLISRPYSGLESPSSLAISTAEIRDAFQQSRPRKRNKRHTRAFEIIEDQDNTEAPRSPDSALPSAMAATVRYQFKLASRESDTRLDHTPSSRILETGNGFCLANAPSAVSFCPYGSNLGVQIGSGRTNDLAANPRRDGRRNAPPRASKRAPLRGLHEDLNAPALVFDRPGANLMKENVPPGWEYPSSKYEKNEKTYFAPSQMSVRNGLIYESISVPKKLSKIDKSQPKIAHGAKSTKKAKLLPVWRYSNSLEDMAHRSLSTCNSFQTLISQLISSIITGQPLTANSISHLSYYLASAINSFCSIKTSTKRKAATMEDIVRATHAKLQLRAVQEAETTRVPARILLKNVVFSGRQYVGILPLTWELERGLEYHKHVDNWLRMLRKKYGVHAGSLRRRFVRQPLPVASLIKDYLLCVMNSDSPERPEPQSLEELLLRLGCSTNHAAQLNRIKKLDLDFLMAVVAVLALKAQSARGNAPTRLRSLLSGVNAG